MANIFQYSWFPFHFADVFFSRVEAFYFKEVLCDYSFHYVPCSREHFDKNTNQQTTRAGEAVEKRYPSTSLVGMQTGAATVGNNTGFPLKTKNGTVF